MLEFLVVFLFTFFTLNIVRHGVGVYKNVTANPPTKYNINKLELIVLGVSVSYVLTCGIVKFLL